MTFNRRRDRPPRGDRGERDWEPHGRGDERRDRPRRPREPWRPAGGAQRRPDRAADEGGMSIRLDPRRLSALKRLAAEAGLRPGELVTRWVEERLDADRQGAGPSPISPPGGVADLVAQLDALSKRVAALEGARATPAEATAPAEPPSAPDEQREAAAGAGTTPVPGREVEPGAPRRRGRPRKAAAQRGPAAERVALHEEIAAVIDERGPSTAAEIAESIVARGRYTPPRSGKPLDAATVNSRVSNPVYRSRFVRHDGRIALAEAG